MEHYFRVNIGNGRRMANIFILDIRKRCMVNFTLRPLYPCEEESQIPSGKETGSASELIK
jgi:hypothetical protein